MLVPAQTHVATAHAVEICGATPVFVDADPRTGNVDLDQMEAAVTQRTRAVPSSTTSACPSTWAAPRSPAATTCSSSRTALCPRRPHRRHHVGLYGDIGCFSFYPVKHITTGEGGMVTDPEEDIADRAPKGVRRRPDVRRAQGARPYDVTTLGLNYRMSEMEAAIGVEQLKRLDPFLEKRPSNSARCAGARRLDECPSSTPTAAVRASHYCLAAVSNDLAASAARRSSRPERAGVGTSVYYPQPCRT